MSMNFIMLKAVVQKDGTNGTNVSLLHKRSRKIFRLMPVKTKLITHRQAASEDHAKNCDNNEEYVSSTPEVNTTLTRLPVCE